MAEFLTTTVQVNFGEFEDKNRILWEEDQDKSPPDFDKRYVRLYPPGVPIRFATSGSLSGGVTTQSLHEELLVFSGNADIQLKYPEAFSVSTNLIGKFYDKDGNAIPVTFSFDASRNKIVASSPGYAAVQVTYKAKYDRFLFKYSGGPCPGLSAGPYSPAVSTSTSKPYNESILVALDPTRDATASLQMSPPECDQQTFFVNKGIEAELPQLDLMIDPNYPVRLTDSVKTSSGVTSTPYLASMTKLRLIPSVGSVVNVDVNHVDASIVLEDTGLTEDVDERLVFSGSSSVNLEFQSLSKVALTRVGVWRDKTGSSVLVDLRGPGDTVIEVDYLPNGKGYTNPRKRTVGPDEVVACDVFGKAIEVFGVAEASYTYKYDLYRLDLPFDAKTNQFGSVYVTAVYQKAPDDVQPATLFIEAPSLEGLK